MLQVGIPFPSKKRVQNSFSVWEDTDSRKRAHNNVKELVNPLLANDRFKANKWWYGWKLTSYEKGYNDLYKLIKDYLDIVKS